MDTSTSLRSIAKHDLFKPVLSRAFTAVSVTALSALLLLVVVPAVAGATGPSIGETMRLALPQVAPVGVAAPKVSQDTRSAAALRGRAVLRTRAPLPRPRLAAGSTRKTSASRAARTGGWMKALVSWYGPGFYGRTMAGGGTLQRDSMVVAHRSLPFGTRIMFSYNGRSTTAVVRDRGPYAGGRTFDLGPGTARALGFSGVGTVRYRILGR